MMKSKKQRTGVTYAQAGVNIDAGESLVDHIRETVQSTHSPRVMGSYGGFAGLFRLDYGEKLFARKYREPVLAACTDGVGTKLKVAFEMKKFDTIGTDLVAMNVNDLVCCGAEPLFFLDYLATGRLDTNQMSMVVRGIAEGCRAAGCALLGGETAEMPGFYGDGEFDIAGFAVGVVERSRIIDGGNIEVGDVVIGLGSSGIHSNGYGLARKVLQEIGSYNLSDRPELLEGRSVGEALIEPTRIYTKNVLAAVSVYTVKRPVKAMVHITGGGLAGNIARLVPPGFSVKINGGSWPVPPIFELISHTGPVDPMEMRKVFNMGIGFVLIVSPHFASPIMSRLSHGGERCFLIGKIKKGSVPVAWN